MACQSRCGESSIPLAALAEREIGPARMLPLDEGDRPRGQDLRPFRCLRRSPTYVKFVDDMDSQLRIYQKWRATEGRTGANIIAFKTVPHAGILKGNPLDLVERIFGDSRRTTFPSVYRVGDEAGIHRLIADSLTSGQPSKKAGYLDRWIGEYSPFPGRPK